jgi:hypothetical protein
MNDTDESTSVSDDVEAVGQNTEHISDVPDDSALTDPIPHPIPIQLWLRCFRASSVSSWAF